MRKFVFFAVVAIVVAVASSQNSPAKNFYDCIFAQPNLTKFRDFFDLKSNTTSNAQPYLTMSGNTLFAAPDSVNYDSAASLSTALRTSTLAYMTAVGTDTLQTMSNKPYVETLLNSGLYSIGGKPARLVLGIQQPQYALNNYATLDDSPGISCPNNNKIFIIGSFVFVPEAPSLSVPADLNNIGTKNYGALLGKLNFLSSLDGSDRTIIVPANSVITSSVQSSFTAADAAVHILTKAIYNNDVVSGTPVTATTLAGSTATLTRNTAGGITITVDGKSVNTQQVNVLSRNGVIHIVDGLLSSGKANGASFVSMSTTLFAGLLLTSLFALF